MSVDNQSATSTEADRSYPLAAWFLGPRAENAEVWQELIDLIFQDHVHWRRNYFPSDPVVLSRVDRRSDYHQDWFDSLVANLESQLNELKNHFPFHSPRYVAHMLSEQTLPSVLGYFAGMLYNPNNVTEEAAPVTVELELEVGKMVAEMLGYNPKRSWAHICSGGTIANLEALWVARTTQFIPFFVKEFAEQTQLDFVVKTADLTECPIRALDKDVLIALRPNESLYMLRRLAKHIHDQTKRPIETVLSDINAHFAKSEFNVARRGLTQVLNKLGMRPVVMVSASAHYSIAKAANVLGYGEDAVRAIPVNQRFQIDMEQLQRAVFGLKQDEYVAAVIGIVGTTEEGAVDPIHQIHWLRKTCESTRNRSFWFHVDSAWGGYIRSLFCGLDIKDVPHSEELEKEQHRLSLVCDEYIRALNIEERFTLDVGIGNKAEKTIMIRWASKDVYLAFLAMQDADSITIDPHKLGFVPYPAGIVAFRNGLVTELIQQRAQYISDEQGGLKSIDKPPVIDKVGPFVLEGSKPGAAALSCWLAHKTIPLKAYGHGKIMRTTLLNAQKLFRYLVNHRHMFKRYQQEVTGSTEAPYPFTFVPFFEPDTNIVCFLVRPMMFNLGGKLEENSVPLEWINRLNERIYARASITDTKRDRWYSSAQPFYVSRTRFEEGQYAYQSITAVLRRMGVTCSRQEYAQQGVFVLRSTVMNPWYYRAEHEGMNYLYSFVKFLHGIANDEMLSLHEEMRNPKRTG